jgi:NAD(P)-dependent dehydrogenase (short-subunit alcohol dehydrogenase family)
MPLLDADLTLARKLFDVNVFGVISTIQIFSSLLIAARGTIVIIGSVGGVLPYPFGGTLFLRMYVINQEEFTAHPNQQQCTLPTLSVSKCIHST